MNKTLLTKFFTYIVILTFCLQTMYANTTISPTQIYKQTMNGFKTIYIGKIKYHAKDILYISDSDQSFDFSKINTYIKAGQYVPIILNFQGRSYLSYGDKAYNLDTNQEINIPENTTSNTF